MITIMILKHDKERMGPLSWLYIKPFIYDIHTTTIVKTKTKQNKFWYDLVICFDSNKKNMNIHNFTKQNK